MATGIRSILSALLAVSALAPFTTAQQGPAEAKAWLEAGNRRFQSCDTAPPQLGAGARRTTALGQNPRAVVLTCTDSDVAPEHVFQAGLGELVVIRLAGNCVDTETIADIEQAASRLAVPLLVVLGHERCTTVAAAIRCAEDAERGVATSVPSPALQQLLQQFEPSVRRGLQQSLSGAALAAQVETEHATAIAAECLRRSETLRRLQQLGRFQVQPARYHQETGAVEWLLPQPLPQTPQEAATVADASPPTMAPHVALRLLQAGNRRYLGDGKPLGDISPTRRAGIQKGQQPFAIVLTCSDSRVPPEHVFDCGLGELCVIRIAGHVMTDTVLASLELAASQSGAPVIVVLGHSDCTTIQEAGQSGDRARTAGMRALVDRVAPAFAGQHGTSPEAQKAAVAANALRVVSQARQRSITLQQLEQQGRLLLLPAVYDIASGDISWLAEPPQEASGMPALPPATPHGESHAEKMAAPHHEPVPAPTHGADGHDAPHVESHVHTEPHHGEHGTPPAPDLSWAAPSPEAAVAGALPDVHAAPMGESHAPAHAGHDMDPAAHAPSPDVHMDTPQSDAPAPGANHGVAEDPHAHGHVHGDAHDDSAPNAHPADTHDPAPRAETAKSQWNTVLMLAVTAIASFSLAIVVTMRHRN